ncbi:MAG: CotH kinase family protein [Anaerolineales bacterium]|nr:CotH kinase family protein [Anaerolineales bacterium]
MKKTFWLAILLLSLSASGCTALDLSTASLGTAAIGSNDVDGSPGQQGDIEAAGKPDFSSHSSDSDPDYETVFPEDAVNRIDIVIAPEDWEAMQADMVQLFGEPGSRSQQGRMPADAPPMDGQLDGELPAPGRQAPGGQVPAAGEGLQAPRQDRQMPLDVTDENPIWVEATIIFNGDVWEHVGIRYKGNSTLRDAWSNGSLKLPFKLDFDQFEDEYPETEDQRFFGFKQLTLANNNMDASFLREVTASEVFSEAGLVIAESALYVVYLDYGEGSQYLGLYTMVEVVEDTVLDTAFGSDDGNIYKAEGAGSSFAGGTRSRLETSFDRENNEDGDWSDLQELYDILHASVRTENPAAWREELETVLNVDTFLHWLAVTTLTQDWDTYGNMSHNYYLYHNLDTDLLEWISWDKSWAFSGNGGMRPALSLDLEDVSTEWPLIRFLMDDPVYAEVYADYMAQAMEGAFEPEAMEVYYRQMADLIAPYAVDEVGEAAFERAIQALIDQAYARYEAALDYLAK